MEMAGTCPANGHDQASMCFSQMGTLKKKEGQDTGHMAKICEGGGSGIQDLEQTKLACPGLRLLEEIFCET